MTLPTLTLNDGFTIPALGFGTYPLVGDEGRIAVRSALKTGYRLLDSAVNYENEGVVGLAAREYLARGKASRSDVTVQTKLPGRHHAFDRAIASGYESLARLGLDRIDIMLIHWPNPSAGLYKEAWRALIELRERGVVRSIGVSNFNERLLDEVIADSGVVPAINQVELHPYFPQTSLMDKHAELGIVTQAWSPLGKRKAPYAEPVVVAAAERLGVTPAQVVLRWHLDRGSLPLPKSATPARQAENLAVDAFSLLPEEVEAITALGRPDGRLFGGDPETHEEM
ncbi:aldo/keto reductase [Demequina gelatinilytica]|uniref:aldo/keto reductase n=1 Tax=Demequina gelatinilytica TaxID=1638980 RepID=UPI0007840525|nr:aldo/keto reductase [Demequina gelatinilytica]